MTEPMTEPMTERRIAPCPPVGTVRIEKAVIHQQRVVWVVLSQRFTELRAAEWLAEHPDHRRVE